MGVVNDWGQLLASMVAMFAMFVGFARWMVRTLDQRIDQKFDEKFDGVLEPRFRAIEERLDRHDARFDSLEAKFDTKVDGLEERLTARIDRVEQVTDVRLKALEGDVHLIKAHLLGSPSAA